MITAVSAKELTNKQRLEDAVKFEELTGEFLIHVETEIKDAAAYGNNFIVLGYGVEYETRGDGACMIISW